MQINKKLGYIVGAAAFVILLLIGDLDPTRPQVNTIAGIALLMAILWITEAFHWLLLHKFREYSFRRQELSDR